MELDKGHEQSSRGEIYAIGSWSTNPMVSARCTRRGKDRNPGWCTLEIAHTNSITIDFLKPSFTLHRAIPHLFEHPSTSLKVQRCPLPLQHVSRKTAKVAEPLGREGDASPSDPPSTTTGDTGPVPPTTSPFLLRPLGVGLQIQGTPIRRVPLGKIARSWIHLQHKSYHIVRFWSSN